MLGKILIAVNFDRICTERFGDLAELDDRRRFERKAPPFGRRGTRRTQAVEKTGLGKDVWCRLLFEIPTPLSDSSDSASLSGVSCIESHLPREQAKARSFGCPKIGEDVHDDNERGIRRSGNPDGVRQTQENDLWYLPIVLVRLRNV